MGENVIGGITIATGSTAAPVSIGRTTPAGAPSLAGSNRVQLNGLYHYFYSGSCIGSVSLSMTIQDCNVGTVYTNADVTASSGPTSYGYDQGSEFWYPPAPGHYLVQYFSLGGNSAGNNARIEIQAATGGSSTVVAAAQINTPATPTTLSCSAIITFTAIGSNQYINVWARNLYQSATDSYQYNRLSITRVA
jgi:hypothetical protein